MKDEDLQEAVARIENVRRTRSRIPENITPLSNAAQVGRRHSPGRPQAKGSNDQSGSRRAPNMKS